MKRYLLTAEGATPSGVYTLASYGYSTDEWGGCTTTTYTSGTAASYNPFRYRGYYYDSETGFYYLQSRYYDPVVKRFISPDSIGYLGANGNLISYNMYSYCSNNPVVYTDPSGHMQEWLKTLIDIGCYVLSAASSVVAGVGLGCIEGFQTAKEEGLEAGLKAGIKTAITESVKCFGTLNNLTNAVYYTLISDSESDLTPTSYHDGYINRWDRLDYAKQKTEQKIYNNTARMYFSEYNLHMYGWFAFGWADGKGIPVFSFLAKKAKEAGIEVGEDGRSWVDIPAQTLGNWGL